jgi:hypothetical protein
MTTTTPQGTPRSRQPAATHGAMLTSTRQGCPSRQPARSEKHALGGWASPSGRVGSHHRQVEPLSFSPAVPRARAGGPWLLRPSPGRPRSTIDDKRRQTLKPQPAGQRRFGRQQPSSRSASIRSTTSDAIAGREVRRIEAERAQNPSWAGRSGTLVGHGWVRPAVLIVAVTFPPAAVGSSVCWFRTPDRHRLPGPDQLVVPDSPEGACWPWNLMAGQSGRGQRQSPHLRHGPPLPDPSKWSWVSSPSWS